jgi:DNA-binding NtrC family response regulator
MLMRLIWITVDKEAGPQAELQRQVRDLAVETTKDGFDALERIRTGGFDAALVSFPLPGWTAEDFLEETQRVNAFLPVIIQDPSGTLSDVVRMVKLGAYHFFGTGSRLSELVGVLEAAVEYRHSRELALFGAAISQEPWRKYLVGESQPMQNVAHIIRLVGSRRCTVLITGETGTGKEMVARAVHMASPRSHLPMVAVNCSALPENLLEAELFGHVKGAFTGAWNSRVGRFEQAHRSTLFLDEIGDMPMELQAKLLRVLQEREFQRLGSSDTVRVDVRVVAASNVDLTDKIRHGKFREDLYYRLNVVPIVMPPLRDRLRDIPLLVHHFIEKICRQEEIPPKEISQETLERLTKYTWPGNVRQLENAVEMAIALSGDRRSLYAGDFALPSMMRPASASLTVPSAISLPDDGLDFDETICRIERSILEQALQKTRGNKKMAADLLRLKRTTLAAKLKSLEDAQPSLASSAVP